ncbi:hypothetical protein [Xanthomonas bundabergensis]|uniref:hypothetical protein n=1 Tax=Xanthomonas bundabergensis TaxID=3160842 RepID=UPI00351469F9
MSISDPAMTHSPARTGMGLPPAVSGAARGAACRSDTHDRPHAGYGEVDHPDRADRR